MFDWMSAMGGGSGGGGAMPDFSGMPGFADLQNLPGLMQDGGGGLMSDGNGGLRPSTANDYYAGAIGKAMQGFGTPQMAPEPGVESLPGGKEYLARSKSLADQRLGLLSGFGGR